MNTTYTVYIPGQEPTQVVCDLPEVPSYDELTAVLASYFHSFEFEHVNVYLGTKSKGYYTDMFVDELGHLVGMPHNEAATIIYRNNVKQHDPKMYEELIIEDHFSSIVGPAIVFDRKVWF